MTTTYMIPETKREKIQKLVTKYQKKAQKYGQPLNVTYGETHAENATVWAYDDVCHDYVPVQTIPVEVFDLTITGEVIRKDGYDVVARVEHLEGGNVVSVYGEDVNPAWSKIGCHCDHCNKIRDRKVTYIVRDQNGEEKNVGKSCLHDYCGIDPQGIGLANELTAILLADDASQGLMDEKAAERVYDVGAMLILAKELIKSQGYVRSDDFGSNKNAMITECKGYRASAQEIQAVKEEYLAYDENDGDTILRNIKSLIQTGYCKTSHFGYIAYAPVALEKYKERMKKKAEREQRLENERASEYIGEVNQKVEVDVRKCELLTSWYNDYGTTYLYKFIDNAGNVLIWFASSALKSTDIHRIKGTVKDHNEREGVKQTILTRVKAY